MSETGQDDWPIDQQDHPLGAQIGKVSAFRFQFQDEEGRWMSFLGVKSDRDEMTRVQADRVRRYPQERQRILHRVLLEFVDEVVGDGEGETSRDALIARNEEITARLLGGDAAKKVLLPNGQTLDEYLETPK